MSYSFNAWCLRYLNYGVDDLKSILEVLGYGADMVSNYMMALYNDACCATVGGAHNDRADRIIDLFRGFVTDFESGSY